MAFTARLDTELPGSVRKMLSSLKVTSVMNSQGYDTVCAEKHDVRTNGLSGEYWCLLPIGGKEPLYALKESSVLENQQLPYEVIALQEVRNFSFYRR